MRPECEDVKIGHATICFDGHCLELSDFVGRASELCREQEPIHHHRFSEARLILEIVREQIRTFERFKSACERSPAVRPTANLPKDFGGDRSPAANQSQCTPQLDPGFRFTDGVFEYRRSAGLIQLPQEIKKQTYISLDRHIVVVPSTSEA